MFSSHKITSSAGILYYKDNFQTPKFTSIFRHSTGKEYRRQTFKFSSLQWRSILSQDYYIKKASAEKVSGLFQALDHQVILSLDKVIIRKTPGQGEIALSLDSWQKLLTLPYPYGWTPLNSIDCEVSINDLHYLTIKFAAEGFSFFANEKIKQAIIQEEPYLDSDIFIDIKENKLSVFHPRNNEWPMSCASTELALLKKLLSKPIPEK